MGLSKTFHETIGVGIAKAREAAAKRRLKELEPGEHLVEPMPVYISQFANADRNLIEGFYRRIKDKVAAERFGAEDLNQFSYWAWRSCGIACIQAVLQTVYEYRGDKFELTTMDLIREGLELGRYDIEKDVGWYHKALVDLSRKHGLESCMQKFIPAPEIALIISNNNYVISSVKSNSGGHLLLLYGFKLKRKDELVGFWYHDPNNFKTDGMNRFISKEEFNKLSTRRIIRISLKNQLV